MAILMIVLSLLLFGLFTSSVQAIRPGLADPVGAFPAGVKQSGVVFCDDAEHGNLGWQEIVVSSGPNPDSQGSGPNPNFPNISTWHITSLNSFSPTHSFWIGNEVLGTYDTGVVHRIFRSPAITLPSGGAITLSYESNYKTIESDPGYDLAMVSVDTSGGLLSAKGIASWDPDDGKGWISYAWDISSLAGQTIHIQLEFNTDDNQMNAGPGWFVDDICVTGSMVAAVGGHLIPVNKVAILAPYLALLSLVGAVTAVVAATRKRKP